MIKKKKVLKPEQCNVCKAKINKNSVGHTQKGVFTCEECFIKLHYMGE